MQKYRVLTGAVVIQMCLGGIYAWSVFVPCLRESYGLSMKECQTLFGATILMFTGCMIVAGRLLSRLTPRVMAACGACLLGIGYAVASVSQGSFGLLFLGLVILTGIGIGLCYIGPLAAGIRWFPERKGLVTGLVVAGFGGGAILLSNLVSPLLAGGMDVLVIFRWVGGVYGIVLLVAAGMLAFPDRSDLPGSIVSPRTPPFYSQRVFWLLCAGIFCGSFSGLMIIGNLEPIGLAAGVPHSHALMAVSMMAVGNALGRVGWGYVFDRWGAPTLPLSLILLSLLSCGFLFLGHFPNRMPILSLAYGTTFGACFVVYAGMVAHVFGPAAVGKVYPVVFLAYGAAGLVGPATAGWLFDWQNDYSVALILATLLPAVLGLLMSSYFSCMAPRSKYLVPLTLERSAGRPNVSVEIETTGSSSAERGERRRFACRVEADRHLHKD